MTIVYDDSGGVVQQRDGAIFTSVESCEQAGKARLSMILLASTSVALISAWHRWWAASDPARRDSPGDGRGSQAPVT